MTMTAERREAEILDGRALQRVLRRASATLHASPWSPLLTYHGIDVLDALAAPLHHALLRAVRRSTGQVAGDSHKRSSPWNVCRAKVRLAAYRLKQRYLSYRAAQQAEPMHSVDYLFWPRSGNHFVAHRPVIAELRKQNASLGVLTSGPAMFAEVRRRGESAMFAPAAWPEAAAEARREGRRRAAAPAWQAQVRLDSDEGPAEDKLPTDLFRDVLIDSLPDACVAIALAEQAVERLSPRVIVVGYDITLEGRAACLVGRARGIPTAVLMQGSFSGASILKSHVADRVIVYGNAHRRDLENAGVPADRIAVCGAPYLDRCPKQSHEIDARIVRHLGLDRSKPYLFVATSGPGHAVSVEHHQQTVDAVTRLAGELPECQIVVKLHPKDSPRYYEAARSRFPQSRLHVVPHGTEGLPTQIFDWFQGCNALLTGASATAFEAMVLDVPVVSIDLCHEFREVSFIDAGATAHVRTYAELKETVQRLTDTPSEADEIRRRAKPFLAEMFYALDGRSAQRASEALSDLANLRHRNSNQESGGLE